MEMNKRAAMGRYDKAKAKKKKKQKSYRNHRRRKGRDGEKDGIMIMLRQQLFSCGEQLYPLKGMKPEPGQEPLSGPL